MKIEIYLKQMDQRGTCDESNKYNYQELIGGRAEHSNFYAGLT